MRRRQVLAALPLAIGIAGCSRGPSGSNMAGSPTDRPEPTSTPSPTPDPPPASVIFRSALRYVAGMDSLNLSPPNHAQFAFVRSDGFDYDRPPDAYELVLGNHRLSPLSSLPGRRLRVPAVGQPYSTENRSGWLVFDVPLIDADAGSIHFDGRQVPLPGDSLPAFAAAPSIDVQSVTVPNSVAPDEAISVTVSVTNQGDRDGLFLAAIQQSGLPTGVEIPVPAGEARTSTIELGGGEKEPGSTSRVKFVHAEGSTWYEIPVEGAQ